MKRDRVSSSEKGSIAAAIAVIVFWLLAVAVNLALLGVIIWGIIELVQWVTVQNI